MIKNSIEGHPNHRHLRVGELVKQNLGQIFLRNEAKIPALNTKMVTVTEVKGFGRQRGHTELYRGAEYIVDFLPKLKLEIATSSDQLEQIVDSIISAASTGKIGDGKIFVSDLEQVVRIRTGETGEDAI